MEALSPIYPTLCEGGFGGCAACETGMQVPYHLFIMVFRTMYTIYILWRLLWIGSAPKGGHSERPSHHCLYHVTVGLPVNQETAC